MMPSILCCAPPSVEFLGPTTLRSFQTQTYDPQQFSKQIDAVEINIDVKTLFVARVLFIGPEALLSRNICVNLCLFLCVFVQFREPL